MRALPRKCTFQPSQLVEVLVVLKLHKGVLELGTGLTLLGRLDKRCCDITAFNLWRCQYFRSSFASWDSRHKNVWFKKLGKLRTLTKKTDIHNISMWSNINIIRYNSIGYFNLNLNCSRNPFLIASVAELLNYLALNTGYFYWYGQSIMYYVSLLSLWIDQSSVLEI